MKVLEEALGELKNVWQKGESFKTCVSSTFKDIHCQLQDEISGIPFSLQEIKAQFRTFVKDDLFREESITKEKIKDIFSLQSAIAEANKEYLEHTEFDKDMEKCLGTWTHATANTTIPRGMEIVEALKKFRYQISNRWALLSHNRMSLLLAPLSLLLFLVLRSL
ncbi:hypothetical protein KI387_028234 [Taxus chinensis]|uniref:Uncharacterized protein n=1 Tax=Taxus chinensis TaxID=29808 RepID=A0AA38G1A9_TAXCH|nr:hypothetical protein KI387_028234 [Taxus chinensis]